MNAKVIIKTGGILGKSTTIFESQDGVNVHHGMKGYIGEVLEDVPDHMELMLVEKYVRKEKEIERASVNPMGQIRLLYTDGSSVVLPDANKEENSESN